MRVAHRFAWTCLVVLGWLWACTNDYDKLAYTPDSPQRTNGTSGPGSGGPTGPSATGAGGSTMIGAATGVGGTMSAGGAP